MQITIARIEWGSLEGRRPRSAGCNARLGEHGAVVHLPLARVTTADGAIGFGWARLDDAFEAAVTANGFAVT